MNGVDKIIEDIRREADDANAKVLKDASAQTSAALEAAKKRGDEEASRIHEAGARRCEDIKARAASASQLKRRQMILKKKQELIAETEDKALEAILSMPADEYFDAVVRMAVKNAQTGEGTISFGKKDLDRLPADFESRLSAALPAGKTLKLSKEPAEIGGGFVLGYGGIEENCTFRAVMDAQKEEVQDLICKTLFN